MMQAQTVEGRWGAGGGGMYFEASDQSWFLSEILCFTFRKTGQDPWLVVTHGLKELLT